MEEKQALAMMICNDITSFISSTERIIKFERKGMSAEAHQENLYREKFREQLYQNMGRFAVL